MTQMTLFQGKEIFSSKWYLFKDSKLGKIHASIPWAKLASCLPKKTNKLGAPRWFDEQGMFGIMFLKSYLNLSDEKLIDRFNTDWALQLFCGRLFNDTQKIKDTGIISRIRSYLADHTDWRALQDVLLDEWKGDMNDTHALFMDATCYESFLRYPTDIKLLWESCEWVYEQIFHFCKELKIKRPRHKFLEQKNKQLNYSRKKRKGYKVSYRRKRSLLYLLNKGLNQLETLLAQGGKELSFIGKDYLSSIYKVLEQQTYLFNNPSEKIKDRIVSLSKPYLRPIVRGKENKRVEFGLKAHILHVDGICIIDRLDFNAFNECKQLEVSVLKHKSLFGSCHQVGADRIYATNANRRFLTKAKIFTCFPRKGPKKDTKEEKKLRSIISSVRATRMEGAFGNHKQHYGLEKIKAKKPKNEVLWVFFGVMTANAVEISKRRFPKKTAKKYQLAA